MGPTCPNVRDLKKQLRFVGQQPLGILSGMENGQVMMIHGRLLPECPRHIETIVLHCQQFPNAGAPIDEPPWHDCHGCIQWIRCVVK